MGLNRLRLKTKDQFYSVNFNSGSLNIALDFDSVLSDTMISWVNRYNEKFQSSISKETHILKWEFWNDLGISSEQAFEIFDEVWSDWHSLPPTEQDLKEKVEKISDFGTVDIVTEIKDEHLIHIKLWLKEHDIPHGKLKHAQGKKAKLDYDYFIDDHPDFALECSSNGKNCLLYDQPWNKNIEGDKITRINGLNDALGIISKKTI